MEKITDEELLNAGETWKQTKASILITKQAQIEITSKDPHPFNPIEVNNTVRTNKPVITPP